ncbi:Protein of unknown function [Thermobacillus xylanilyticus]|uniref:Uncharacterized protein n=1 Tax=Thermobacillus xylanilyticus TaxID=76633 RepID=A0ABM8V7X7_THEXY|nr:Protein of unknown function [Thermobacillus xylanilyticus]
MINELLFVYNKTKHLFGW